MKRSLLLTSSPTVNLFIIVCLFLSSIFQPGPALAQGEQPYLLSPMAQTTCAPITLNSPESDFIATDQTITFSWTAPTDCEAIDYEIMIDFDDNMQFPFIIYQSGGSSFTTWTYKIEGSWNNRDLYWEVHAFVGRVDDIPQFTPWSIRRFHTDFNSVKITHNLPVFNGVKKDYDLPQPLYFLPMNSSTTLSATVSGNQVTNPEINWEIRSGGGTITNSTGATATFQSGSAMSDTLIRASSVEFPGVFDEFSIHTFADFNVNMTYYPEVLYDSVLYFQFAPIMDGFFAGIYVSDNPTRELLGVTMSGAGSIESSPGGFIFNSPSSEETTTFHLFIKEYPTFSKDVQVNTVYGGPINVPSVCFTPEQWYVSAGDQPENFPLISSIYYKFAPIGEMMYIRLGFGVTAPATEPIHSVDIMINNYWDFFGPYPLHLESGTAVGGVWSATFPTPDTLCKFNIRNVLIYSASNALFTKEYELYIADEDSTPPRPVPSGVYDSTFDPGSGTDSNISKATLQQDGKILIGGDFTHYNGVSVGRIARLNADGSLDEMFNTGSGADWTVNTVVLQPDGKILLGGMFTSIDGTPRRGIARLNADGSLDTSFDPGEGFDHVVNTIQLQPDGKIFVGGNFSRYNNNPAYDLIRLNSDGTIDTSFDTGIGADGAIKDALLLPDGKYLLVGKFERYNRIAFPHIVRINSDGTLDQSYQIYHENWVASSFWFNNITTNSQGNIYLSGYSYGVNVFPNGRVIRLNSEGEADHPFEIYDYGLVFGLNYGAVNSTIELPDGRVLLAGSFFKRVPPNTSGISDPVPHLMMLNQDGSWDTSFTAFTNRLGTIDQLLPISDTQILAVGRFSVIDGVDSNGIALLSLEKPPVFLTSTLPNAEFEQPYSTQLKASGLPLPKFTVTAGVLPNGINLNPDTGEISGTPTEAGDFNFTVEASNGINPASTRNFSLTILNEYTLTITSDNGTVARNPNQATYHEGDVVQLNATPNAGWNFANWTGALTSSINPDSVTIHGDTAVTANYTQNEYTLTITSDNGTVARNPNQATYHEGDVVQLNATPNAGWSFANWTGALTSSANPDSITMHGNTAVTANFTLNTYTLSVSKSGTGSGTVTSNPAGIDCGSTCSYVFAYTTGVTLTATASTGSTFTGWSGSGCSSTGTCTVTMDAAKAVTATFTLNTYLLSVSKSGPGNGMVTSSPAGIDCGSTCSASFNYNTSVTLTAAASTGSTFSGWSGSGCAGTGTCTVIMNVAKSATANFIINNPIPTTTGLSPSSETAGGAAFTLTVNGTNFVNGSTVRWDGANRTTTFINNTQLTAAIPAGDITVGVADITVFNPAPGGGTSNELPFFITTTGAEVTGSTTATGNNLTITNGNVSANTTGTGTVTVAQYASDPGGTPTFTATGQYFDVHSSGTFTSVTIDICGLASGTTIYFWTGTAWVAASNQSYSTGCVTVTVNATTVPNLTQLAGAVFGAGHNDAPVANAQSVTTNEDTAKAITLTGTDADGDTLTYSVVAGPSHGTLSSTAPALTYTPAANYNGPDSFTFKANDGTVNSATATVSITVTAVNDAPIITEGASINVTMSEDGSTTPFSLTLHATDVDGDTITWSNTPAGHGTALARGTGTSMAITYTPAPNYIGSDSFVVQVFDGNGGTDMITVNVIITAVEPTSFTVFLPLVTNTAVAPPRSPYSCR